ncbi:MAG: EAL domain-containing protein [Gammaproteobacteria bacterium]|nr:EAL domain-containing protein [Gammaproteobacteria bacterium]MBU1644825.1 EAL domain-containing protein [Gammaproteobacteria bacterium]MBU1973058.1 EAL domain-containing protein [Gammaproteobacteria bacterium]
MHDFDASGSVVRLPLAFLTFPPLAWAALRFGHTGGGLAGLAFAIVAAWSTATGHGTFAMPDVHLSLFLLWSYMAITVMSVLLITALQAERVSAEETLRHSTEKLRGLYELSPVGIAMTDMQGKYVEFNAAFERICGYSCDELNALDYWALTPREYADREAEQLESLNRTGAYGPYEKEYIRKDGNRIPLRLNGVLIRGSDGESYIWSIVEDITERKHADAALRVAAAAFESQEGMMVTDADGVVLRVNRAFTDTTGYAAEEIVGKTPRLLQSGRHNAEFYRAMWESIGQYGVWQGEVWDRHKSGREFPKWLTISAVKDRDGVVTHYIGTHYDITERKKAEDRINALAFYDQLTGLPNRTLLLERLNRVMATASRTGGFGALLFIDLDNFKTLNDTQGHEMGDQLLKQVANRLSRCLREGDTAARQGGDEFVVLLPEMGTMQAEVASAAEVTAEKILLALNQPYRIGEFIYNSSASIGVSLFQGHLTTVDDLLKQADLAMYRAKSSGRNVVRFFDPAMEAAVKTRAELEEDLRRAIAARQFILHYQAQVIGDGRVTGAEVLLRWRHPARGMVAPAEFIPLAEETDLILPLGRWVLESACHQLAEWASRHEMAALTIAVNVSARQFHQRDFVDQVLAIVRQTGANPHRLKLELTESLLVHNVEEIIEKMHVLKAKGIGFSLDDFGTGYSSLSYLKRLPLDQLKIDQSFVRDVLSDPNDAAIARTVVALAESLGLAVIAEGVETGLQRDFLANSGCHAYQGYFFSKPLPVDEFERLVQRTGS